jgi:hypothetical protein
MTDKGSVAVGIERFLKLIWLLGDAREFRFPHYNKYGHTALGYFNNPLALAIAAAMPDNPYGALSRVDLPKAPWRGCFYEFRLIRRSTNG